MKNEHVSVLLNESIDYLNIKKNGIYVDLTLGRGGHSQKILEKLDDSGLLIAIDRDETAITYCKEKFKNIKNIKIFKSKFSLLEDVLKKNSIDKVDGILADFGVSSPMLDEKERGFSFSKDALLDMRMDKEQKIDARFIVNNYEENELSRILYDYSEEKWHKRIAHFIVTKREKKEIETTLELAEIVRSAIPRKAWEKKKDPATRTFQAIRIEVNEELKEIEKLVNSSLNVLKKNSRACFITFHSKELNIIKKFIKEKSITCTCPKDLPICICNTKPLLKKISKKPIEASTDEVAQNIRSRSAKLIVFEKL